MADIGAKISIDGEKQFRQDLQNITQQGKTLAAEMDKVSTAFKNADDSEKDMGKVTETLNKQIENQRKLVDKLKEAVENSAKKTGENSTETLKWKEKLAKAEKGLDNLEKEARDAAKGVDILGNEEKDTAKETSIFGDVLKANLASEAIKKGVSFLADAVKDVAKFFVEAVTGAAKYADEMNTLSKQTGISTETLQEYEYAAKLVDVDVNTITGSLRKLTKSMSSAQDGTGEQAEAFAKLGVSITDANGELRDSEDVFNDVIDALGKIPNETERDALAMEVLGKSAQDLNPLIEAGADAMNDLRKEAHKVGAVLDQDTLDTLNEVQDGFDRLGGAWESLKRQLGAKLGAKILPDLEKLVGLFQRLAETGDFEEFADGIGDMLDDIVKKIPQYTNKIIRALPKVITSLTKALRKLLPDLAKSVAEILGQLFSNLPSLVDAGVQLGFSLIEGVLTAIPKMVSGIVNGFKSQEISAAAQAAIDESERVKEALAEIPTAMERTEDALIEINGQQKSAEKWFEIFKELRDKTNPTADDMARMKTAAAKLNEIMPELGLTLKEETGGWNLSNEAIEKNIKLLEARARASAYYASADDALQEIARLELELSKKQDELKDKIAGRDALKPQVEEMRRVLDELTDLYDESGAGFEAFAKAASEYAGYEITNLYDANKFMDELAENLAQGEQDLSTFDTQINQLSEDIDSYGESIKTLNDDVEWLFDKGAEWESEAEKTGKQLPLGLVKGIKSGTAIVKDAASGLMKSAIREMKDVAQIHSPSKVTENLIGKNLALGVIKGWEDVFSMRNPLSLRGAINGAASTTNNMNLGGVSVNVYAQEGQDANAIAQLVMRKMQGAVDARKAVFA